MLGRRREAAGAQTLPCACGKSLWLLTWGPGLKKSKIKKKKKKKGGAPRIPQSEYLEMQNCKKLNKNLLLGWE